MYGDQGKRTVDLVAGKECQVRPRIPRRLHRRALRPGPILVMTHRDKQPRALRQAPVVRVEAGLVADIVAVALEEAQQRILRPCPRTQTSTCSGQPVF